jgi:hypothetical protein
MAELCQSCGLSQAKESDWGTETDGSKSHDYCMKCYTEGKFVELNITIEDMSRRLNEAMKKIGLAKRTVPDEKLILSGLKRWKTEIIAR